MVVFALFLLDFKLEYMNVYQCRHHSDQVEISRGTFSGWYLGNVFSLNMRFRWVAFLKGSLVLVSLDWYNFIL